MNRYQEALVLLRRNKVVGLSDACHLVFEHHTFPTENSNRAKLKNWLIKQKVRGSIIKASGNYSSAYQLTRGSTPQVYLFNRQLIEKAKQDLQTVDM